MQAADKQLIYEVSLDLDPDIQSEYDAWLEDHVAEMLTIPGFLSAEISRIDPQEDPHEAWPRRCVRYRVASQEVLADYLKNHAPRMRALGVEKFGDQFRARRRILRDQATYQAETSVAETPDCPNCGTPLHGQYCWQCGQRSRVRLITLWELLREAVGDLFELDSRLWRSLIPLLFRPGLLTSDYLAGRRARYMPPFRMYLVLSIIFFLVWGLDSDEFRFNPGNDVGEAHALINEQLAELEQLQQQDPDPSRHEQIAVLRTAMEKLDWVDETAQSDGHGRRIVLDGGSSKTEPGAIVLDAVSGASPYEDAVDEAPTESAAVSGPAESAEAAADVAEADKLKSRKGWNCEKLDIDLGWAG